MCGEEVGVVVRIVWVEKEETRKKITTERRKSTRKIATTKTKTTTIRITTTTMTDAGKFNHLIEL